jgi:hypothetical protein
MDSDRAETTETAPTARMVALLRAMDDTGWAHYVIERRADEHRAYALIGMGVVASMRHEPGAADWKLGLTREGRELRGRLLAKVRADEALALAQAKLR